jgi:hypothetical protein
VEIVSAESPRGLIQRTFTTRDGSAIFTVDITQNQVVVASMPGLQKQPGIGINRDQALLAGRSFVTSHVPGADQLTLVQADQEDHGAAGREYQFLWARQVGSQKALGPERVAVSVDANSGAIVSFMRLLPVPITVNVEPKITRDQALAIAQQRFNASVIASSISLDVWWKNNDRSKEQVLRWKVTLVSSEPINSNAVGGNFGTKHAAYMIDAHTGAVLDEMR